MIGPSYAAASVELLAAMNKKDSGKRYITARDTVALYESLSPKAREVFFAFLHDTAGIGKLKFCDHANQECDDLCAAGFAPEERPKPDKIDA